MEHRCTCPELREQGLFTQCPGCTHVRETRLGSTPRKSRAALPSNEDILIVKAQYESAPDQRTRNALKSKIARMRQKLLRTGGTTRAH